MASRTIGAQRGVKLGQALAAYAVNVQLARQGQSAGWIIDTGSKVLEQYWERSEGHTTPIIQGLLSGTLDPKGLPEPLASLLREVAFPGGQILGQAQGAVIGNLIGFGLAPLLAPASQIVLNELWPATLGLPNAGLPISPADAADMVV